MAEGVAGYPRWQGALSRAPAFPTIAGQEIRRALRSVWTQAALLMILAYAVLYLNSLNTLAERLGDSAHTRDAALQFIDMTRWGALIIAAVMTGPALLDDKRRGALELYLSRAVTRPDYLAGKVLAVVGLTSFAMILPALVYYGASFLLFENQPDAWNWFPVKAIGYALLWTVPIAGAGLGLSCVARSSRAASLLLFGGVALLDLFVSNLLANITRNAEWSVLSPLAAHAQQTVWLFGVTGPYKFPTEWGLFALGALAAAGWALVAWKHPRIQGGE